MSLCTLHPSLTSLLFNLEAQEQLSIASVDSNNETLFASWPDLSRPPVTFNADSNDFPGKLAMLCDETRRLKDGDMLLWSEGFLSREARSRVESLVRNAESVNGLKISCHAPGTISEIFQFWDSLGKMLGKSVRARDLHQRAESQMLDWTSNFYARLRGKRTIVLAGLAPLVIAGSWIADLVRRIGAISPELAVDDDLIVADWDFVKSFDPHTIILAPLGASLAESSRLFFDLEKLPAGDRDKYLSTAAAKRGEVYFSEGSTNFYSMDYRILRTLGVVVSACAGFESGYITERDSFYKLRYLELHRHRIV